MNKAIANRIYNALRKIDQKANVSGWIVLNKAGEHVATIRFSYPRDGAGKLQVLGADWTREKPEGVEFTEWTCWQYGWANGCGYDKATAALSGMTFAGLKIEDNGNGWDRQFRDAGYKVIQAV